MIVESIKQPKNCISTKSKLLRALTDPYWLGGYFLHKIAPLIKDDATYIKWDYFFGMHKFPNLDNPSTYNEKLQWAKLNDRNPLYGRLVDKAASKEYVAEVIGNDRHIIPTIGVWDTVDEIDFKTLPTQFVIKTTHDSGGIFIVRDKNSTDIEALKAKVKRRLKKCFFMEHREFPYKMVKPRVIVEKLMVDELSQELKDYKFFCFNGRPRLMFVASDRPHDTRFDFFDMDFRKLPIAQGHPNAEKAIEKPSTFEAMKDIAAKLSKGFPQVRIDLYEINGEVYFGEFTFFHFSGNVPFSPSLWDEEIGSWWQLSR